MARRSGLERTTSRTTVIITKKQIAALTDAREAEPHAVLGMHVLKKTGKSGIVVRAFVSGATSAEVIELKGGKAIAMEQASEDGLFEVFIPRRSKVFSYQIRVTYASGESR